MQNFESKRADYITLARILEATVEQEQLVVSCYNKNSGCNELSETATDNLQLAINYLQMQNLSNNVLVVDEKVILRNINDYLSIKAEQTNESNSRRNATVNAITINDPIVFHDNFYRVPVTVELTATNKENILSFLHNVEKRIANNPANRVWYTIDKVAYDVANYDKEQPVIVDMSAFYLKK